MPESQVIISPSPAAAAEPFRQILGIRFYVGDLAGLLRLVGQGGLIAVPSAPVLVGLSGDHALRTAIEASDFAITDSGFMIVLWRLFQGERLERISGLKLLSALFRAPGRVSPGTSFWIMPSAHEMAANLAWLKAQGHAVPTESCYIAPHYPGGSLSDHDLLRQIEAQKPAYVLVNLGGGVQERLGLFLRQNLSYRPAIICTGAAIAFLSRQQANIPPWADRLMLGWLMRIIYAPGRFLPRYRKALQLVPLLWKYRGRSVAE